MASSLTTASATAVHPRTYWPARYLLIGLGAALPLALLGAVIFGAVNLPWLESLKAMVGLPTQGNVELIVTHIRLPRALLALCVGALLGISGTAMQGLFRNPLADPSLIGVSAGAVVGASFAILFGGGLLAGYWGLTLVSLGAFVGGVISVGFVYRLATSGIGTSVPTMLLAGIAISALAGSLGSLLEFTANNDMLRRISLWKMGGLDGANTPRVVLAALLLVVVMVVLPRQASALNALLLGESEARYLGVDVDRVKRRLIIIVAAAVGLSVSLAGTIAFIGLVVPHMMRLLGGPDHRYLLPASALAGAIVLLLADIFARVVLAPTELPVGIVTAAIGAPFFIYLLSQRRIG